MSWLGLPIWAGDFDWLVVWIELDGEVGQVQLFRIGSASADGSLNMFDLLFLQNRIGIRAAMPTIRVDCVQSCALLQIGSASASSWLSSVALEANWTLVMSCSGLCGSQVSLRLAT